MKRCFVVFMGILWVVSGCSEKSDPSVFKKRPRSEVDKLACKNNLREISHLFRIMLEREDQRTYPDAQEGSVAAFQTLADYFGDVKADIFICPGSKRSLSHPETERDYKLKPENVGYLWTTKVGIRPGDRISPLACCEPGAHRGGRNVVFPDSSVQFVLEEEFQEKYAGYFSQAQDGSSESGVR